MKYKKPPAKLKVIDSYHISNTWKILNFGILNGYYVVTQGKEGWTWKEISENGDPLRSFKDVNAAFREWYRRLDANIHLDFKCDGTGADMSINQEHMAITAKAKVRLEETKQRYRDFCVSPLPFRTSSARRSSMSK